MANQKLQGTPGVRPLRAAQLGLAVFTLWAGAAAAQSNAPVTGTMGGTVSGAVSGTVSGTDSRAVATTSAAPVAQQAPVAPPAQQAPVAQSTAAPSQQAVRIPADVVRRTSPPVVGSPARDGMLGDETEALLAVQSNNLAAGPGLPMLGATASRAYRRYLESFNYAIPAFFTTMVQSDNGTGGGGGNGGGATPAAAGAGASQ
ncbi:DUF3613 domain-containing protein [Pandoraea oxalativorans]|uniref:DUF3613 domain-containing protein n=1 Tax=Pandoraea oxalativorans TaxID=573737 RepID=A0A0E3U9X8_9BURK|nr:DUF3613 domain-containing protein [Pandoraea oxalativorans]AKC72578.2 hypothetical protein MB84_18870 [Pandoraea oxalativorans]